MDLIKMASSSDHASKNFILPGSKESVEAKMSIAVPIYVGSDLLLAVMRLLSRSNLDAMPLVGRSFHRLFYTAEGEAKDMSTMLPQYRLIGEVNLGENDTSHYSSFCTIVYASCPTEMLFNYPRVSSNLYRYRLDVVAWSEEQLPSLLTHQARLRAALTILWVPKNGAQLFARVRPFMSLWDDCPLRICFREKESENSPNLFDAAALSIIGNCSALFVYGELSHWAGVSLSDPALLRCQSIYVDGCEGGITLESIAEYLLPGAAIAEEGKDVIRNLFIRYMVVPEHEEADCAPMRLKQLIEQRLSLSPPQSNFIMQLRLCPEAVGAYDTDVGKFVLTEAGSGSDSGRGCGSFEVQHDLLGDDFYYIEASWWPGLAQSSLKSGTRRAMDMYLEYCKTPSPNALVLYSMQQYSSYPVYPNPKIT